MSKKKSDGKQDRAHNLVIFKTKEDYQSKTIDKYSFEKIDQEDKIKLANDFKPFGGHYRYSILLENQSLAPISEVKIKIKFPEFLTITRAFPPTLNIPPMVTEENAKQITLEFDEINEKSHKQIHLHFTPNTLDTMGEIRTIVTYVNNKDTVRVLDSRPGEIIINRITIEPKIIPSRYIREFSQIPGIKKVIKSLGIEIVHKVNSEIFFNLLEKIFSIHKFQLIAKDTNKKILWYFGTDLESKEDILAIGQIVSNKIEIMASSHNQHLLISFLTLISNDFKEHILMNEIVNSKDTIHDLECKQCGGVLPYFPKKGKKIECKNCNYEQIVW